ncbi:hypothetical protein Ancab_013161, partial [Ancistrocladus abbreviatus]
MATHRLRLSGDRNKALQRSYAEVVKKHSSPPTSSIDHRACRNEIEQEKHITPTQRKVDQEFVSPNSSWEWLSGCYICQTYSVEQ